MCDPATLAIASLAITTTGSVAGIGSQMAQASAQSKANERQAENIQESAIANYDLLASRREQEEGAASQQIMASKIDAAKARATATVAAGEAGVTGLSVDSLLADLNRQEANYADGVNQNLGNTRDQLDVEAGNIQRGATSRINSLPTVQAPNYAGALENIATAGVKYYQRTNP